jgi:hypothetical protein
MKRIVSADAAIWRGPLKVGIAAASSAARIPGRRSGRLMPGGACFFFCEAC